MKKKFNVSILIAVMTAIVLVILLNVFMAVLSQKAPLKIDLTENKRYELSDRTKEFLKTYNTPVTIYIFESASRQDVNISEILARYGELNENIKIEDVNPAENPLFGKEYTSAGEQLASNSVIVASEKRYRVFTKTSLYDGTDLSVENKITPALEYVAGDKELKAYIVTGHGELEGKGLKKKLTEETYETEEINLTEKDIPDDASLVICFRPTADFSEQEITRLNAFMEQGGDAQIFLDVDSKALTNLYKYILTWGIYASDQVAVEVDENKTVSNGYFDSHYANVFETDFTESIVQNNRNLAYLAYAKALDVEFEVNGTRTVQPVLSTSELTFTANDITDMTPAEGVPEGARMIAGICTDSSNGASMYVSGMTMFLSVEEEQLAKSNLAGTVNYEYYVNLLNYTLKEDSSFKVNEKSVVGEMLAITEAQKVTVRNIVVIAIPVIFLIAGVIMWIIRREL